MTEIKSLVLEHLHALLKRQADMHADLREMRMYMRAMNGQLSSLDHLVSALVTATSASDGEIEHLKDRLDRIECHLDLTESQR